MNWCTSVCSVLVVRVDYIEKSGRYSSLGHESVHHIQLRLTNYCIVRTKFGGIFALFWKFCCEIVIIRFSIFAIQCDHFMRSTVRVTLNAC